MEGELYEVETMYPKFAKQASDVGEQVVAERFTEIPEDELAGTSRLIKSPWRRLRKSNHISSN